MDENIIKKYYDLVSLARKGERVKKVKLIVACSKVVQH